MQDRTDAELVDLSRHGEGDAFGILAERYRETARRFALRLLRREDLAEELVQEAVLQAYRSIEKLRDPERFKSWLCGIVLNISRSYLRERRDNVISLDAVLEGVHPSSVVSGITPECLAERKEENRVVFDAVAALSSGDRDVLLLFYWAGLSVAEIAIAQARPPDTIKVHLHRARQRLKDYFLEFNPELVPSQRRRRKMIKVTIADVVSQHYPVSINVVVLWDEEGKRALPIWIGQTEAQAIAIGLREFSLPRPTGYDFVTSLLQSVAVCIEEVRIESLREETFYAIVKVRSGKKVSELDARPSDAMALAVLNGCPIYVMEDVLERGGADIPPEAGRPSGTGIETILRQFRGVRRPPTKEDIIREVFVKPTS